MNKRKVISNMNLPIKMPLIGTIMWYLLLDKLNAPGWTWGVIGTVIFCGWLAFIIVATNSDYVDIFKSNDP